MPIYDYRCKDCGEEFEQIVKFEIQEPVKCDECQSENIEKLPSYCKTFILKGRDWPGRDNKEE